MAKMIQLVIAMAALLVCAYSLPVRTPEEQADKELRDLKSGLSATNQVLVSELWKSEHSIAVNESCLPSLFTLL